MYNEKNLNELIELSQKKHLPIMVFGAGYVGEAVCKGMQAKGVKVEGFLDNNVSKQGTRLCGTSIMSSNQVGELYKDAIFIIATVQYYHATEQLKEMGYNKFYTSLIVLHNIDISLLELESDIKDIEMYVKSYIRSCNDHTTGNEIEHRVFAQITEKCSLKCKDCKTLMQYFKSPEEIPIEENILALQNLLRCIKTLYVLGIVGGEPFLHEELYKLVNYAVDNKQISNVSIFTNGTIIPTEKNLECLKSKKIFVHISEYEVVNEKANRLCALLDKEKIQYHLMPSKYWTDYGDLKNYNYSEEDLKELYANCWKTGCTDRVVYRGKLITCVRAGFGAQLGVHSLGEKDYINLLSGEPIDLLKKKVQEFLEDKETPPTCCQYCLGVDAYTPTIPSAIQADKPLERKTE